VTGKISGDFCLSVNGVVEVQVRPLSAAAAVTVRPTVLGKGRDKDLITLAGVAHRQECPAHRGAP